eukprot:TRINITY_DN985_c0_g1_i1.p3 TRINITY_DN985_c0_g1~~TRINITY_DN985_c0_g1_i1.p3  ORF type:complete len:200 (-),score=25.32 TRINITY_DN985_c0_g1_i1:1443-2042(-)
MGLLGQAFGSIVGAIVLTAVINNWESLLKLAQQYKLVSGSNVSMCEDLLSQGVPFGKSNEDYKVTFNPPNFDHVTLAGQFHHGMKQVEVWLESFTDGFATPIHRHNNEEVFIVLNGAGQLTAKIDGKLEVYPLARNSTLVVPPNLVHQVKQKGDELFQFVVVVSNPPVRLYTYSSWENDKAEFVFPLMWDRSCPEKFNK